MPSSYSPYLHILYDQLEPVGDLGRGTHYSVLRAPCWHGLDLRPLRHSEFHDFAVIWDEDHDRRVVEIIEKIYFAGLLSPILFLGEKKGFVTVLISPESARILGRAGVENLKTKIEPMMDTCGGDVFQLEILAREGWAPSGSNMEIFLRNIEVLWELGPKGLAENTQLWRHLG